MCRGSYWSRKILECFLPLVNRGCYRKNGPEGGHITSHRALVCSLLPRSRMGAPVWGAAEAVRQAWQQEALKMCELSRFPWQLGPRVLVPSSWVQPDDWHEPHALPALRWIGCDGGLALLRPWLVAGEQRLVSAPGCALPRSPCAARRPAPWGAGQAWPLGNSLVG